jgi:hypothetical protein
MSPPRCRVRRLSAEMLGGVRDPGVRLLDHICNCERNWAAQRERGSEAPALQTENRTIRFQLNSIGPVKGCCVKSLSQKQEPGPGYCLSDFI